MDENNIKTNSLKAWFLASRPKTLIGAIVPVAIGVSLAFNQTGIELFSFTPAILCLLFASIMQIDANFINDYFDYKRGNDKSEVRLGPQKGMYRRMDYIFCNEKSHYYHNNSCMRHRFTSYNIWWI